jgi:hypothetical protein
VTLTDAPDPLDVLAKLLGTEGKGAIAKPHTNGGNVAKDELELELDFEDLSLREFVSRESSSAKKGHAYATQTIEECRLCESASQDSANPA